MQKMMRNKLLYEEIAEVYNRELSIRIVLREDENGSMTPVIELNIQKKSCLIPVSSLC